MLFPWSPNNVLCAEVTIWVEFCAPVNSCEWGSQSGSAAAESLGWNLFHTSAAAAPCRCGSRGVTFYTVKTNTSNGGSADGQMAPNKVKQPLFYCTLKAASPVKQQQQLTAVAVMVVKSTPELLGRWLPSCWAWNTTFDTLGWLEKAGFGTTLRPKHTGSSAGHRRRLISVNNQSALVCHDRLQLTWKIFLCTARSGSPNRDAVNSICCWWLCCSLPTS